MTLFSEQSSWSIIRTESRHHSSYKANQSQALPHEHNCQPTSIQIVREFALADTGLEICVRCGYAPLGSLDFLGQAITILGSSLD